MFESNGVLITWATVPIDRFFGRWQMECQRLADHRLAYLEIEGELSGGRGSLRRVLAGNTNLLHNSEHRFIAEMNWQHDGHAIQGLVECQRNVADESSSADEIRGAWLFTFKSG